MKRMLCCLLILVLLGCTVCGCARKLPTGTAPEPEATTQSEEERRAFQKQFFEEHMREAERLYEEMKAGRYVLAEGELQRGTYAALFDFDGDGVQDLLTGIPYGLKRIVIFSIYLMRDGKLEAPPRTQPLSPDVFTEETLLYENGVYVQFDYPMDEHTQAEQSFYRVIDGKFFQIASFSFNEEEQKDYRYTKMMAPYESNKDPYEYPFGNFHDENAVTRSITPEEYRAITAELTGGGNPVDLPWRIVKVTGE